MDEYTNNLLKNYFNYIKKKLARNEFYSNDIDSNNGEYY